MKTTIKFRDAVEVLNNGACYVYVDDSRLQCRDDYIASQTMMRLAVDTLGDYNVTGITARKGTPCFILRHPLDSRPLKGDDK